MSRWIPDWATHYAIKKHHYSVEIILFNNGDSTNAKPIAGLAKELAIADVCQQIKDKPLHSRMDIIGQNGNTGEHYDEINPDHYKQGGIECIDAIEAALTGDEFRGYCKGNVMKYTWRERHKQQKTALEKAKWYLERLIMVMK